MLESGYYPAGAEYDPSAPYNQVDPTPEDFDVDVCYVLTRAATISSDNYTGGYYDCEGFYERAVFEGDVKESFEEEYYTPMQLIEQYCSHCEKEVDRLKELMKQTSIVSEKRNLSREIRKYNIIISSCKGWEEEFEEV